MTRKELIKKRFPCTCFSDDMNTIVTCAQHGLNFELLDLLETYGKLCFEEGIKACVQHRKECMITGNKPFNVKKLWDKSLKNLEK